MKINGLILLVLTLVNTACSEVDQDKYWPRTDYQLQSGAIVTCRWAEETQCGVTLTDCTDGQKYTCQTGVIEL